jgi:PAS domain S-box-containing protein
MPDPFAPFVQMAELLDTAPGIMYCVKSADGRYLAVNHAFAERVGKADRREVVGRRATDLFAAHLAEPYESQDRAVIETGRPLRDALELIADRNGHSGWFVSNKQAIRNTSGDIVGVAVLSVDLRRRQEDRVDVDAFAAVMALAPEHLTRTVEVAELAAAAGLTATQLERRMRRALGLSPRQYLVRLVRPERVHSAVHARRRLHAGRVPPPSPRSLGGWFIAAIWSHSAQEND